jgi:hypothetical protein
MLLLNLILLIGVTFSTPTPVLDSYRYSGGVELRTIDASSTARSPEELCCGLSCPMLH